MLLMRPATLLAPLLVLLALLDSAHAAPLPMRPYSGIGVVRLPSVNLPDSLALYEEPGLVRSGLLKSSAIQGLTAWLFGADDGLHLLVTARKGDWLRVEHDEAGRESWLQPPRRGSYTPWNQFLKGKSVTFLRNAPKRMQQLHTAPDSGASLPVTAATPMKIIKVQGDWSYVLLERTTAGWIRWRDQDSRLLVGLALPASAQSR